MEISEDFGKVLVVQSQRTRSFGKPLKSTSAYSPGLRTWQVLRESQGTIRPIASQLDCGSVADSLGVCRESCGPTARSLSLLTYLKNVCIASPRLF